MRSYLFYDIETTGLNKAFDQVLQFAAIRTDLQLNELERHEIKIKLNCDVTPSPYAIITHHIGIAESQQGIPEIDGIKRIHALLNTPGTISLGYNTLGFDDEFLRFSFYRNLLPPYTHQYANQCSRMDLYPMAIMYYLYKNTIIQWPTLNEKPSLKLAEINAVNQFATGRSHNAMVDVEVTLALARRFYQEKEMWDFVSHYFDKKTDMLRSQQLPEHIGLMIRGKFGTEKSYHAPVLQLGTHYHYKNQTVWLRLDSEELATTTLDNIATTTFSVRKKMGEPGFILPLKERFLQHTLSERLTLMQKNLDKLKQQPDLLKAIIDYHCDYQYPVYAETDTDARLYLNAFLTPLEERTCQQFHAASSKEKAKLADTLTNPSLRELALRILGKHYPETMTTAQLAQFNLYMTKTNPDDSTQTPIDFKGEKRLTKQAALASIADIRQQNTLTAEQVKLLTEFEIYLKI